MGRVAATIMILATVMNVSILALILWLYRQIRLQHTVDLWYRHPLVGAELALSMQLEALQVMLIVIGLGLTGLGAFGFKSVRDAAEQEAGKVAGERAEEMVRHHLKKMQTAEGAVEKVSSQQSSGDPEEPDPADPDTMSSKE